MSLTCSVHTAFGAAVRTLRAIEWHVTSANRKASVWRMRAHTTVLTEHVATVDAQWSRTKSVRMRAVIPLVVAGRAPARGRCVIASKGAVGLLVVLTPAARTGKTGVLVARRPWTSTDTRLAVLTCNNNHNIIIILLLTFIIGMFYQQHDFVSTYHKAASTQKGGNVYQCTTGQIWCGM
jgi:hypothetical protein